MPDELYRTPAEGLATEGAAVMLREPALEASTRRADVVTAVGATQHVDDGTHSIPFSSPQVLRRWPSFETRFFEPLLRIRISYYLRLPPHAEEPPKAASRSIPRKTELMSPYARWRSFDPAPRSTKTPAPAILRDAALRDAPQSL